MSPRMSKGIRAALSLTFLSLTALRTRHSLQRALCTLHGGFWGRYDRDA